MKLTIRKIGTKSLTKNNPLDSLPWLKITGIIVATLFLMMVVYYGEQTGIWFKASILEAPQPFNGTVMPVYKVPVWSYWHTQNNARYDSIPANQLIDLPPYDLEKMNFPDSKLVWGDQNQDSIRNVKITYSVVYMGNYKLDHLENAGSHLAVDIKTPVGTPVHSIANGKVIKTSLQSSGFGHHVVIRHVNVPDPDFPGQFTTLYSAYNHLDRIDVKEGQNVLKGEMIGTSGNTGTATTPHLHFQIDRDSAPWHPYWPFTWQESQQAGLSFFEAVNAGLGKTKGKEYTVNPMKFVSHNLSFAQLASTDNTPPAEDSPPVAPPVTDAPANGSSENNTVPPADTPPPANPSADTPTTPLPVEPVNLIALPGNGSRAELFEFGISGERVSLIDNGVSLIVTDAKNQMQTLNDDEALRIQLSGVGALLTKELKKTDFKNKTAKVTVRSSEKGAAVVTIGKSSFTVSFIDQLKAVSQFKIEHDGNFRKNIAEKMEIIALDEDGNVAPAVNFSGIVTLSAQEGSAQIIPETLEVRDFKNGVAPVKIIMTSDVSLVLRAQNGALVGVSQPIRKEEGELFTDIQLNHPNYLAIQYLKEKNVISGYPDGSFKPNQTVNRAEALKMLLTAFSASGPSSSVKLTFSDIEQGAWYVPALSAAVERGIVKGYDDGTFRPGQFVNRAEYLKILFATNSIKPKENFTKPYDDVDPSLWFAGYAFLANKMNILDNSKKLYPDRFMTRGEVAETVYRMKVVQENNLMVYSK